MGSAVGGARGSETGIVGLSGSLEVGSGTGDSSETRLEHWMWDLS